MRAFLVVLLSTGAILLAPAPASSKSIGHCNFDTSALSFAGTPIEQARCLLSPVGVGAVIGPAPQTLGQVLETHIGQPARIDRPRLLRLLTDEGLSAVAATLDSPVSQTSDGAKARYFVIHDTSQKYANRTTFPDDADKGLNRLGFQYPDGSWVAHAFINRRGEILLAYDFKQTWRATKFESSAGAGQSVRGLFLHIEHNQPRLSDPKVPRDNDLLSPNPGFTAAQYDRSALLYIVASVRAGSWLIPAYHAVLDDGISDGHDDPQHWDRTTWEAAIARRLKDLGDPDVAGAAAAP